RQPTADSRQPTADSREGSTRTSDSAGGPETRPGENFATLQNSFKQSNTGGSSGGSRQLADPHPNPLPSPGRGNETATQSLPPPAGAAAKPGREGEEGAARSGGRGRGEQFFGGFGGPGALAEGAAEPAPALADVREGRGE